MKKKMFILISFIFCLSLMLPISIQAAQRKESVIYSDFFTRKSIIHLVSNTGHQQGWSERADRQQKAVRVSANVYYVYTIKNE